MTGTILALYNRPNNADPTLRREGLAKKQTISLEDTDLLRDLIVKMSTSRSIGEAIETLLEVDEEEDEV